MPLDQLERDIKSALLGGDKIKAETLKGVKSALQYEAVAKQKKLEELSSEEIEVVLRREVKKRQEAIELYKQGNSEDRAAKEQQEADIIGVYLPEQLSETEIEQTVVATISELFKDSSPSMQDMGRIIGAVKQKLGGSADGATVAKVVKTQLEKG